MKSILLVDNEKELLRFCQNKLTDKDQNEFKINHVHNYSEALGEITLNTYNFILVYINFETPDFFHHFYKKLKTLSNHVDILYCTDNLNKNKIYEGIKIGIYDIYHLPLEENVILYRLLNLEQKNEDQSMRISLGEMNIDLEKFNVTLKTKDKISQLDLTLSEFKLLLYLARRNNTIVSREEILQSVWSDTHVQERTVDAKISNLRKKLEHSKVKITSVKNLGYKISA